MVIDLDIESFFDELDHDLLMKALDRHVEEKWIGMYVERCLKSPVRTKEGKIVQRHKGTPQGGVISPLLANLFLHYCFDKWMQKEFSYLSFERYADDILVHCRTPKQANYVLNRIRQRIQECKLQLHAEKTKIVYCRDSIRTKPYQLPVQFTFLGYSFQPRICKTDTGSYRCRYRPAISPKAVKSSSA